MNLAVTCEFRFFRTPDGQVWTESVFLYEFWLRYLEAFSQVTVIARIQDVAEAKSNWQLSSGQQVAFVALPYYVGFSGLVKNALAIRKIIRQQINLADAVIFRVPSQSITLAAFGKAITTPYGVEVVGDPYDVFSSGITGTWLDRALAVTSCLSLKRICRRAEAACYVTQGYLQQRYPAGTSALSVGCSDIELPANQILPSPRSYSQPASKLVFVGSLEQLYKGPDTLIEALQQLNQQGIQLTVNMLGCGRYLAHVKQLAEQKGCADNVNLLGAIEHAQVSNYLDEADVFVMPSRTEGLPRALIEAMARGLPCVASNVGGIPELLPADVLVEKNDPHALADCLKRLCLSPEKLTQASAQNLEKSKEYELNKLAKRRTDFYCGYKDRLQSDAI
ncbi:glycosyltransferase family 4 protein [Neiella marina]|uniref:Glycosyltransferase family 4 protein n=1 Tax=Neiella holothuriorum TaxID=2870530 RepID=A0ABS7EDZ2_9GAMM|nr:glycosyltransferase [Neiella holothuriorum]MBW8190548.1 glycosyltransferase family 4 protein [Neiella holothuriorum]